MVVDALLRAPVEAAPIESDFEDDVVAEATGEKLTPEEDEDNAVGDALDDASNLDRASWRESQLVIRIANLSRHVWQKVKTRFRVHGNWL